LVGFTRQLISDRTSKIKIFTFCFRQADLLENSKQTRFSNTKIQAKPNKNLLLPWNGTQQSIQEKEKFIFHHFGRIKLARLRSSQIVLDRLIYWKIRNKLISPIPKYKLNQTKWLKKNKKNKKIYFYHGMELSKAYKRKRNYHGSYARDPIDQTRGINPRLPTQNPIQIEQRERPLKEKLEPHNPHEEMGLLGHKIVTVLAGVPALEFDDHLREQSERKTRLRVYQRRCECDHEKEEEEYGVCELQ
jgi:hypothetical protein